VLEPSQADELINPASEGGPGLVDIRVLDHFIIGDGCASPSQNRDFSKMLTAARSSELSCELSQESSTFLAVAVRAYFLDEV